jgi:hypothetical protein
MWHAYGVEKRRKDGLKAALRGPGEEAGPSRLRVNKKPAVRNVIG